jgi:PEP-CTERM motif
LNSHRTRIRSLLMLALALWCLAAGGTARAGSTTYLVEVNTASIEGTSGYLDFQFNPANSSALAATTAVTNFRTDGTVGSQVYQFGDASGTLPGVLSFGNGTALNELTFAFTYGTSASFDVTLSQSAAGGSGSTFALALLDGDGGPYSNGPATVTITIKPDGSTSGTAYPPNNGVGPTASVMPVPEPSTLVSAGLGLATLLGWNQVRRRLASRAIRRQESD